MIIQNLAGIYTGRGFVKKGGRRLAADDAGFLPGPIDLRFRSATGRIMEVGSAIEPESRESVFDASGLVATAGFIDSHTHALFQGSRASEYFQRWQGHSYREIAEAGGGIHNSVQALHESADAHVLGDFSRRLRRIVSAGTTLLEVKSGYSANSKQELRSLRLMKQARDFSPIPLRSTFLGLHALPPGTIESDFVSDMIKALPAIHKERLADFIDAFPEKGFFSVEESLRFIEAGQQQGLRAKIHADEMSDLGSAATFANAGALSVDHLQKINAAGMKALAESPCVATLLPATSFFLGLEYAPARKLLEAGARVALASDYNPGTAPESSLLFTARLASAEFKMLPHEILAALTWNAAAALGEDAQRGALLPDYLADVLLFSPSGRASGFLEELCVENPLPTFVFSEGRLVHKS